jgi:hypothetical protein
MTFGSRNITNKDHFKLYILFKDTIVFENELQKRELDYLCDPMETMANNLKRYYVLEKDKGIINSIIIKHGIVASTETINMTDYSDAKQANKLFLVVGVIAILLFAIVASIYSVIDK